MQRALLNRATMRVADRTDLSGRVTAEPHIEHNLLSRLSLLSASQLWAT
jgi:hypothetical protein